MPCNSDYMEPSTKEKQLQRTAKLLAYVYTTIGAAVRAEILNATNDIYCRADFVAELCDVLSAMPPSDRDRVIYNARDKTARDLADWWEEHQAADRRRSPRERIKSAGRRDEIRQAALAKLTPAEQIVLGLAKASPPAGMGEG